MVRRLTLRSKRLEILNLCLRLTIKVFYEESWYWSWPLELGHNNFFNHIIFYPLSTKQKKDPYKTPRQLHRLNTKHEKLVTTVIYNFDDFTLQ